MSILLCDIKWILTKIISGVGRGTCLEKLLYYFQMAVECGSEEC
jgi:hypothetical protein